jgi:hypothetical protein
MLPGFIEETTPFSVSGWAAGIDGAPAYVIAEYRGQILGVASADLPREDLQRSPEARGAFRIVFSRVVPPAHIAMVSVRRLCPAGAVEPLDTALGEIQRVVQAFILGSPRSGTSELAATLSAQLDLPWVGEGYVAQTLAQAEALVAGDAGSPHDLVRALAAEPVGELIQAATRRVYHRAHGSLSFVDKTPGVEMIRAAPFLHRSFPGARFIFLRRNGIANVLSRMERFGGDFAQHCQDWVACMEAWERVKPQLPDWLELEQEKMLSEPLETAVALADFLGRPEAAENIAQSLSNGAHERTGAALGLPSGLTAPALGFRARSALYRAK